MESFLKSLPKSELHIHIEGALSPEQCMKFAKRNGMTLPFKDVEELKAQYKFEDLQSFINLFCIVASVLKTYDDYYEMTMDYLEKVSSQGVKHAELMFDPQSAELNGVSFDIVINGIWDACQEAEKKFDISSTLIMCFLRHLSEEEAIKTFEECLPFKDKIKSIGLVAGERGNPPEKFKNVYEMAKKEGFHLVAHAGEEGSCDYIRSAIYNLNVERIDHGVRCIDEDSMMKTLAELKMPCTCCPLSNIRLCVLKNIEEVISAYRKIYSNGVKLTINSDDPTYFDGYLLECFLALAGEGVEHFAPNPETYSTTEWFNKYELCEMIKNAWDVSCVDDKIKELRKKECEEILSKEEDKVLKVSESENKENAEDLKLISGEKITAY